MKIAIYWMQYSWGGVDTHLLNFLKYWPNSKDRFTIFYNEGNQGYKNILKELKAFDNVESVSFKSKFQKNKILLMRIIWYLAKPISFWRSVRQAKKLFSQNGPFDVVFSDSGGYPVYECISAIVAASQLNIRKRMLYVHYAPQKPPLFTQYFEQYLDSLIFQKATDIVANSLATRKALVDIRWFKTEQNPIRVIYPGVVFSNDIKSAT